jgi:hypothetical protein
LTAIALLAAVPIEGRAAVVQQPLMSGEGRLSMMKGEGQVLPLIGPA